MGETINKKIGASDFLALGMYAFAGFGLEIILNVLESSIFKWNMSKMTDTMHCIHWTMTCVLWGSMVYILIRYAKNRFNFDIFNLDTRDNKPIILLTMILAIMAIGVTVFVNGGFKPLLEFKNLGVVKYLFQFVYYLFESALIVLSIAFGQKFGELTFKSYKVPWGGIFLALTWGLIHILIQSFDTGLYTVFLSLVFGSIYITLRKNIKYSYILIALLFIV